MTIEEAEAWGEQLKDDIRAMIDQARAEFQSLLTAQEAATKAAVFAIYALNDELAEQDLIEQGAVANRLRLIHQTTYSADLIAMVEGIAKNLEAGLTRGDAAVPRVN